MQAASRRPGLAVHGSGPDTDGVFEHTTPRASRLPIESPPCADASIATAIAVCWLTRPLAVNFRRSRQPLVLAGQRRWISNASGLIVVGPSRRGHCRPRPSLTPPCGTTAVGSSGTTSWPRNLTQFRVTRTLRFPCGTAQPHCNRADRSRPAQRQSATPQSVGTGCTSPRCKSASRPPVRPRRRGRSEPSGYVPAPACIGADERGTARSIPKPNIRADRRSACGRRGFAVRLRRAAS